MQPRDLLLAEMIDAAEQARLLVAGLSAEAVAHDRQRRDALLWNFTVLGEAAAQVVGSRSNWCPGRSRAWLRMASSSRDACCSIRRWPTQPPISTRWGLVRLAGPPRAWPRMSMVSSTSCRAAGSGEASRAPMARQPVPS
ncbi:MAG: hypothetical protein VB080_09720 [Propionicimonas sp.]|uniref:HepT-like ribonuclease domain-containing protein n=1 Tax=Propionicimonas sp. TaxID=1955623 RepID=UPI002B21DA95|nr:hypothetical protein [Propionicimonas sp.]MEA4944697.1 hypothetical protein [Propionicimonas sp.]